MVRKQSNQPTPRPKISTGVGASDDSSGGGNASGIPDADTGMQPGGLPPAGNVARDREKLFPQRPRPSKKDATDG